MVKEPYHLLKEPHRLGQYISQSPVLQPAQIPHDPTYIDTAGEIPVIPNPTSFGGTQNWQNRLPPESKKALNDTRPMRKMQGTPYWDVQQKEPRKPFDLDRLFAGIWSVTTRVFVYVLVVALLVKLLWDVVAMK